MKKIVALIFLISLVTNGQNQYKYPLGGVKKIQLETNTTTKITVGNSKQLIIRNFSKKNKSKDNDYHYEREERFERKVKKVDKKKGLTAIYAGGRDNTNGFGFSITKERGLLVVRDLKSNFQRNGVEIVLPKNMNISVDAGNLGSIDMDGFTGEVEVETNVGPIKMKNVTGPITAHTSVGPITIDFSKVSQKSPITISSSVAEIDVSLPKNTKADLELKTLGTVYTNFDFPAPPKKGLPNVSGNKTINAKINSGGVKIKIKSSLGNIYLRKK